jgi:hypothetical protein
MKKLPVTQARYRPNRKLIHVSKHTVSNVHTVAVFG